MTSRALINPLPKKSGVSLRATIQNPRQRKYASDADRQKAFRERQAVIQVRVKPETVETFDRIATTLGYSRQEVVYALLMSGLNNNRNWQQTGIPAFRLPRYEENPTMSPQGSKEKDREAIRQLSEYLTANLENKGFKVEINQSGSIAGPSNYLRIYDPLTGRFFNKPIRISTHAKGSFESGNVLDIGTFLEADTVIDEALKMRALGPSKKFERDLLIEKFVEAKIAEGYKPKQAYRLAQEQFFVKENPMKRKATPAQVAARERFAEMARSGAFKRKATTKRKKNPAREGIGFEGYDPYASRDRLDEYRQKSDAELRYIMKDAGEAARAQRGMSSEAKYLDQVNDAATVLYERKTAREKAIARSTKKIGKREASAINRLLSGRGGNPAEAKERKPRVVLITNPKQRMLNISWLTAGGQREIMKVPIDFVFTHYVGNVAERFFARTENGQLIVSEYSTGGKIGQVPFTMRSDALNDRAAAKRYVGEMLSRIGAERFKAAVKKFEPIN